MSCLEMHMNAGMRYMAGNFCDNNEGANTNRQPLPFIVAM